MESPTHLNICIVDDNPRLRFGLKRLLARETDMTVIAEAESLDEARNVVDSGDANMFVVDLGLGSDSGFDLIRYIKMRDPEILVVVLSWHNESAYRERSLELGANAYVVKSESPLALISTLRGVHETSTSKLGR